jgi:hypothetical protein
MGDIYATAAEAEMDRAQRLRAARIGIAGYNRKGNPLARRARRPGDPRANARARARRLPVSAGGRGVTGRLGM